MTNEELRLQIGNLIKTLRVAKGWSQEHLAKLIDSNAPHICDIEKGRENLSLETMSKIFTALNEGFSGFQPIIKEVPKVERAKW